MKGFRTAPQQGQKQITNSVDTELQNMQMALRVSQMMIQQLTQNQKAMESDLGNALNQLYELQYKTLSIQKALNLDSKELDSIANIQRLKDFDEAALKADMIDQLDLSEAVTENSTVTLTSSIKDEPLSDKGIFRSRIKLSESGVPDLISGLLGKKVGERVEVKLNGLNHVVELLSIRDPKFLNKEQNTEVLQ